MPYGSESLEIVQAIRYVETTSDPLEALIEGSVMETCAERRTRKLAELCRNTDGGIAAVAEKAGINVAYLDQILKGVLLPAKKTDGSRTPRSLGDPAARSIEDAFGLGRAWFDGDWPLPMVNQSRYEALSPEDRAYAQAKMMAAIEEREAGVSGAGQSGRKLLGVANKTTGEWPPAPDIAPSPPLPPQTPGTLAEGSQLKQTGKKIADKEVKHGRSSNR